MSNTTTLEFYSDLIPNECSLDYDPFWEAIIYLGTVFYLGIACLLHFVIIRTVMVTDKKHFQNNSFFKIIVMDSIASIILILNELFFNKLFTYITPLCPIVGPFFWRPSVILNIVYISLNHARFSKSVTQIFMVLNRMTCVLIPTEYDRVIWRSLTPISCVLVVILPCGGMWNVWISRVFLQPYRGGFNIGYLKTVRWPRGQKLNAYLESAFSQLKSKSQAALSLFQSIYILTALFFTVVCSSITFFKLIFLPARIKSAEKSLCFTSVFISSTFLMVAATQVRRISYSVNTNFQLSFAFCLSCDREIMYLLQALAFDLFTVGPAVIIVMTSKKIRESLFWWKEQSTKKISVISVSGLL
ncbi:hypothetical protein CRE_06444 [Caenorhabditis remanei]|uniref:Serpentine receptor class gamma n=1 Tax=Caenorhabditis remanei TaxID=31234 RepID=E3M0Z6_CAERE|nr:hypothetical protein CRE_06444 [Caenorhabditis remanei]